MSTTDDGTVTTQENEQYQDSMIEDLFSSENFSEVDTCVEILSAAQGNSSNNSNRGGGTSLSSRRSQSSTVRSYRSVSVSSASRKSKTEKRGSSSNKAEKTHKQKQLVMQPIDEDVHQMVREDVRKMIAKIRSVKQPIPKHNQGQVAVEDAGKMIVAPGKYGECDQRLPTAKKDKDNRKKPKSPKMSGAEQREGDVINNAEPHALMQEGATRKEPIVSEKWVKRGYYKNQPQESPEQMDSAEMPKSKIMHSSVDPSCNVSVASSKNSKKSLSSKSSTPKTTRTPAKSILQRVEEDPQGDGSEPIELVLAPSVTSAANEDNEVITAQPEPELITENEPTTSVDITNKEGYGHKEATGRALPGETEAEKKEEGKVPNEPLVKPDHCGELEQKNHRSDLGLDHSKSALHPVFENAPSLVEAPAVLENKPSLLGNRPVVPENEPSLIECEKADDNKQEVAPVVKPMSLPAVSAEEPALMGVKANVSKMEDSLQATTQLTTDQSETGTRGHATDTTCDDGTVELVLVDESVRLKTLEYENAKLRNTLHFLQQTAVSKEKYFGELAWFGKRSEEEVQKWRPNFWSERLEDLGPELFEEFRADAIRIADPDIGDWEHGFSSGALAMSRMLLGLSHAVDDENICAFHDLGEPCTKHCVTCSVAQQRQRELEDFPVLDP